MAGLETYYGNPTSEHADRMLNLSGVGNLLALSPNRDANIVAGIHFRVAFGSNHIYTLRVVDVQKPEKHTVADNYRGLVLFDDKMTYGKLASLISKGHVIKSTSLSDSFDWVDYQQKHGANVLPLFYIDAKHKLTPFTSHNAPKPESGGKILGLFASDMETEKAKALEKEKAKSEKTNGSEPLSV